MKRLLLALVVAGALVGAVGAMSLDFQNAQDRTSVVCTGGSGSSCSWVRGAGTSTNNYMKVSHSGSASYVYSLFRNKYALPVTYAAATGMNCVGGPTGFEGIILYDSTPTAIYSWQTLTPPCGRYEVEVVGGTAHFYKNGAHVGNSSPLSVNPSYIGFGSYLNAYIATNAVYDDFVYGETENKYVFGNPISEEYVLKKDFITPAATGLYFSNNNTLISSNNMTSTWSKGNITYTGNETVVLQNVDTGVIYATRYTSLSSYGSVSWALVDEIFNSGAPYGRYYVTIPGTGATSEEIWYLGSGATITFDKSSYAGQDIATLTYNIDGAYWDTSTYSYSIDAVSGTTCATMHSEAISAASGTSSYTFTSTDPLGVYYGIVKATKHSDSSVIWMNYDYAELTAYVTIAGYVNDAETQLPISGAVVNITQNSITGSATTIADGNYSLTNYLAGTALSINATASGYSQYYVQFSPLSAKTINLNITLNSTTPAYSGLGIGGIVREGIFSAGTITGGYGRPIQGATVIIKNTSNGESYTKTTSMTGWYLCDEGATCFLTSKRPYDVWGEKPGYSNSQNYTVVAA